MTYYLNIPAIGFRITIRHDGSKSYGNTSITIIFRASSDGAAVVFGRQPQATPSAKSSRVNSIIAIVLHDHSGNSSDGPIISARERVFVAGVPRPLERGYSRKAHLDEAHHTLGHCTSRHQSNAVTDGLRPGPGKHVRQAYMNRCLKFHWLPEEFLRI
ncbi:hypothetical protein BC629DRAFT_1444230 [Irpex lacteus]|nr:hypothetical protein BC629DRAFT_1444230 [Irpex lacteus]